MYIELSEAKQNLIKNGQCVRCKGWNIVKLPVRKTKTHDMRDVECVVCGKVVEVPVYLWDEWAKPVEVEAKEVKVKTDTGVCEVDSEVIA